jgi:hypothetical protein
MKGLGIKVIKMNEFVYFNISNGFFLLCSALMSYYAQP